MKIQTAPVTETNKVVVVSAVGCGAIGHTVFTSDSNNRPEKAGETSQYSRFSDFDSSAGNLPAFDIGAMSAALIAAITIIFGYFYFGPKSAPEEKNPIPEDTLEPAVTGSYMESFLSLSLLHVIGTIIAIIPALAAFYWKAKNAETTTPAAKAALNEADANTAKIELVASNTDLDEAHKSAGTTQAAKEAAPTKAALIEADANTAKIELDDPNTDLDKAHKNAETTTPAAKEAAAAKKAAIETAKIELDDANTEYREAWNKYSEAMDNYCNNRCDRTALDNCFGAVRKADEKKQNATRGLDEAMKKECLVK